jgi:two-component system, NtrC family, sensor histidine kinase HydH
MADTGGGTLLVSATRSQKLDSPGVDVRFADTGPGIPAELREQIFNPFVTTKKTGVGLGLSIVSKIMDGHHGTIRIENNDTKSGGKSGAGSCFVFFFPLTNDEAAVDATSRLVI